MKLLRIERRIKSGELAVAYGASQTRITQIEALAEVTPATATRYLEALAQVLARRSVGLDEARPHGAEPVDAQLADLAARVDRLQVAP